MVDVLLPEYKEKLRTLGLVVRRWKQRSGSEMLLFRYAAPVSFVCSVSGRGVLSRLVAINVHTGELVSNQKYGEGIAKAL
jgi:hypothetical protein